MAIGSAVLQWWRLWPAW